MVVPAPIAWLDADRQLVVLDATGAIRSLAAEGVLWASWGRAEHEDIHSWPTWGPDGRTLAAFRIARQGGDSRVVLSVPGSVSEVEGASIGDRTPIYLQWAPDGKRLAVLSQGGDELVLESVEAARPDRVRPLLRGSPLFFTWLDPVRIAAFVGEPDGAAMAVIGAGVRTDLPGTPGNFCTPVGVRDEIAWVAHHRARVMVLVGRPDGTGTRELEIVDGLVALVEAPGGGLLRAVAPDASGNTSYRDLRHLDPVTGTTRRITDTDCLAFFPAGDALVLARRTSRGTVAFSRMAADGSSEERIAELHPSRDLRFWLRFFEQYHPSHPIVDGAGTTLLLAGGLVGERQPEGPPRIWSVPLGGGRATELGPGLFATFARTVEE